jgi:hypothetical protein
MSRYYRSTLGFSNANETKQFLTGKDIVLLNYDLLDEYNERLIDIFGRIQVTLPVEEKDIETIVYEAYKTILDADILYKLSNHGRAPESVYFVWMQGYLATLIFKPMIELELQEALYPNGADDLSDPNTFSRKSDPDLTNASRTVFVEVQAGFKGSKVDIKKTKVKTADGADYYIAAFDCFNGTYTIINTRDIPDDQWYENMLWEGALCYTIPSDQMKEWAKPNLFTIADHMSDKGYEVGDLKDIPERK